MTKFKVQKTEIAVPREEEVWEKELRERARKEKAAEVLGVPRLTHQGGVLKLDGKKLAEKTVRIIPIGLVYSKQYFADEYEPGSTDTPACYAFGQDGDKGMLPHEAAPDKQNVQCDGCKHNAFNTAIRGHGKRCSDVRRILFLLASDLQKDGEEEVNRAIAKAQHYQMQAPAGSLGKFGRFLDSLSDLTPHGNLREAICEVFTEPNEYGAYTVEFRFLDAVPRAAMPALLKRGQGAWGLLSQPFPVIAKDEEAKPVKGQGKRR